MAPCNLVEVDWCFRGAYCLHHQGEDRSSLWWWTQYIPLKRRCTSTRLHGTVSQKAVMFMLAAVRTWNHRWHIGLLEEFLPILLLRIRIPKLTELCSSCNQCLAVCHYTGAAQIRVTMDRRSDCHLSDTAGHCCTNPPCGSALLRRGVQWGPLFLCQLYSWGVKAGGCV
jgi:hypothetical protein